MIVDVVRADHLACVGFDAHLFALVRDVASQGHAAFFRHDLHVLCGCCKLVVRTDCFADSLRDLAVIRLAARVSLGDRPIISIVR